MPTIETEVLVIGAGPAGVSAAFVAARAGARVVLIDRAPLGGDQGRRIGFVPTDFSGGLPIARFIVQQHIRGTRVHLGNEVLEKRWPGVIVQLEELCLSIAGESVKMGVDMHSGYQVDALSPTGAAHFTSITDSFSVKAAVIVVCDGVRSKSLRYLEIERPRKLVAMQCEVPLVEGREWVDFHLDHSLPHGYAWLYPRRILASIGVAVAPSVKLGGRKLLDWHKDRLVKAGRIGALEIKRTSGTICIGGIAPRLRVGQVIIAGDAAGTSHPMAVQGIASAIVSGKMAGRAAADFVSGNSDALRDYARELRMWFGSAHERALARREFMQDAWDRIEFTALMKDTCLGF